MRPLSFDRLTGAPSVAGSAMSGSFAPARWRAAPSSCGTGIFVRQELRVMRAGRFGHVLLLLMPACGLYARKALRPGSRPHGYCNS